MTKVLTLHALEGGRKLYVSAMSVIHWAEFGAGTQIYLIDHSRLVVIEPVDKITEWMSQ